ncbi:MAG: radical SAM protein, partial [Alphaproteobacteria bacterium]|nr:radical SAM protein [Alphaproteobacteria bacterium]
YPYPHVDAVMELMAAGKILPYLDIPFQHAAPNVLKAMRRPANQEKVLTRIQKWRETVPDLTLRSTFIVGFPGETEDDFQFLLQWLREAQIDRAGCFKYEPVKGAPANELPGAVPLEVQQDRWNRFMEVQQEISAAKLQAKIGTTVSCIIDAVDGEGGADARSMADAPEVDGKVFLRDVDAAAQPGDYVTVTVEDADEYDLFGVVAA